MGTLSGKGNEELRHLLQDAVVKCSERCLYQSAKWAAELLNSLPAADPISPADTEVDSPMSDAGVTRQAPTGVLSQNINPREARLEAEEAPKYLLAKTYFDCREYDRCAAIFLPSTLPKGHIASSTEHTGNKRTTQAISTSNNVQREGQNGIATPNFSLVSQKALFLALYAKYISGEKRKDEESEMILGPADGPATVNKELISISQILEAWFKHAQDTGEEGQGWLEYLYGIVLAKGKSDGNAKTWLTKSVHLYPFNWGVWQELCSLLGNAEELQSLIAQLPQNIMSFMFHIYASQELYQVQDQVFSELKKIKDIFPTSCFLRTQKALLYYHAKDYEKAERIFSKTTQRDPYRLDDLDTYSNILYVMGNRPKLAFLGQLATATDKFRPETCLVVGNYYAMKSEHEKAIMYFRRALTLDRNFLTAWTLMGHEYVELKNTHAAIECYRRAVDVNRKDFRAWYGLGQTYEVLDMHFYALFYYQRAAALSPYDPKMWTAVGSCLAKMNRAAQAIKAYKRALVAGSYHDSSSAGSSFGSQQQRQQHASALLDPEVLFSIACMFDRLGDREETQAYLELVLSQEEGPSGVSASFPGDESDLKASFTSAGGTAGQEKVQGVGVTQTTSRARMWLAKLEFSRSTPASLRRAMQLANELCQDGWEVEEAKALVRDVRAKMAWSPAEGDQGEGGDSGVEEDEEL